MSTFVGILTFMYGTTDNASYSEQEIAFFFGGGGGGGGILLYFDINVCK